MRTDIYEENTQVYALQKELEEARQTIRELSNQCLQLDQACSALCRNTAEPVDLTVYYDFGDGINESQTMTLTWEDPDKPVSFSLPAGLRQFRVDPGDDPCFLQKLVYSPELKLSGVSNGFSVTGSDVLFLEEDPGLWFTVTQTPEAGDIFFSFTYLPVEPGRNPSFRQRLEIPCRDLLEKIINKLQRIFHR